MNKIYSSHDNKDYLPRWIAGRLRAASESHPVVILTGARQVGKSTLLRRENPFSGWSYVTFDDYDALRRAEDNPVSFWTGTDHIVFDEVQKSPAILDAVKRVVDEGPPQRRCALSGSANLLLMRHVGESLAGRAVYVVLHPLTIGEMKRHPAAPILDDLLAGRRPPEGSQAAPAPLDILQQGLMPALVGYADGRIPAAHVEWWEGYVATYLERDLRRLSDVGSLPDFRRLMSLAALRAGGRLNQSELAREARLSQPTTHRYLNLLEATHLIERLPAYIGGRTARLRKSPKLHWADPGLAAFLAGFYDSESLAASREVGGVFETYVVHHLRVLADLSQPRARLFYWRAVAGKDLETDVVVEQGRRVFAFEIKMNETARYADAAGLRSFLRDNPQAIGGAVIYRGRDIVWWDEKTMALPVSLVEG